MHTNFNLTFTSLYFTSIYIISLHFTTHKYPSRYAPIYPPSLHYTHTHFLQFITLITFLTLFLKG